MKSQLVALKDESIKGVNKAIKYYEGKSSKHKKWSLLLTYFSILLTVIGAIMPLIDSVFPIVTESGEKKATLIYWGYLALGLAGGLQLYDRVVGNTNSWIRFIKANLELTKMRRLFLDKWNKASLTTDFDNVSESDVAGIIEIIDSFNKEVHTLIEEETKSWADTYTKGLNVLNERISSLRSQYEEDITKTETEKKEAEEEEERKRKEQLANFGYLKVEINNVTEFDSIIVKLYDDLLTPKFDPQTLENGSYEAIFPRMEIGKYVVEAIGVKEGKKTSKKFYVDVKGGAVTSQSITISIGGSKKIEAEEDDEEEEQSEE